MAQEFNFIEIVDGETSTTTFFDDTLDGGSSSSTSFTVTLDGTKANNLRIRNKISSIVSKHVPEFIPSEYPTFISFIEAYYRFLEQNRGASEILQNSSSYLDIDRTTPEFVKYLLLNYTKDFPISTLANKPFLIKKIKDLYESKGSELSFKLLFRLIYQTDVEVNYPFENVLIPSNGVWLKRASIRVERTVGDFTSLLNRLLVYTAPSGVISYTKVIDYKIISGDYVEIYLDLNTLPQSFDYNRTVYVYSVDPTTTTQLTNNQIVFQGTIIPTVTGYSILKGGKDFKLNQVFELVYSGGSGTLVRISKISSEGAIEGLQIIRFGFDFPQDEESFTIDLDPLKNTITSLPSDIFSDSTYGFTSNGLIIKTGASYVAQYFAEDYTSSTDYLGEVVREFVDTQYNANTIPAGQIQPRDEIAILEFNQNNPLILYPGYYVDNKGFLSQPDIVLQDGEVHQAFAYRTTTNLDVSQFYDVVKKLIHPAGLQLFNNYIVESTLDISSNLGTTNVDRGNVIFEAHDSSAVGDVAVVSYYREIEDTIDTSDNQTKLLSSTINDISPTSDNNRFSLSTTFSDINDVLDQSYSTLQKPFSDTTSATEEITSKYVSATKDDTSDALDDFVQTYLTTFNDSISEITDNNLLNVNLVFNDDLSTTDEVSIAKLYLRDFSDNVSIDESTYLTISQTVSDDITEVSDNVAGMWDRRIINTDYASDYFDEYYVYTTQEIVNF